MGSQNQVTLTFAGDATKLDKTFDQVGAGAKSMTTEVGKAGSSFDVVGDKIGDQERRWQGLRSSITGTTDVFSGSAAVMKGDWLGGSVLVAGGLADLAQGFADTLVPLAKHIIHFGAAKAAMLGHAIASGTVKVATAAWTGVQWALNAALSANPIGLIVIGIIALIAIIVLIATKTTWFQTAWKVAWSGIKAVAVGFWNFIKEVPGNIGRVFSRIGGLVSAPFRAAFNFISDAWNNTVGRLRWTVPGWVPGIGGNTVSVPQLPKFHAGGVVPGAPGSEVVAILQAGERVTPAGAGAGGITVRFVGDTDSAFASAFRKLVRSGDIVIEAG